jgi:S1-C subfamily serine protease
MRSIALSVLAGLALSGVPSGAWSQSLDEVFRRVAPSVVVIRAQGRDVGAGGPVRFDETGSGVLISGDGKVMTAAHVVHAMDQVTVEFLGGETVKARVVGSEPAADLSLLQLERVPPAAQPGRLGNSDTVRVGDQVVIVGAPYGLAHSLSAGWISARWPPNSVYKAMPLAEFFQTDATINTGNSGGPMFSLKGEVIGIVSHNISKSGGSEGLGFVVTSNTARQLLLERRTFWTGLEGQMLSGPLADIFNLPPGTSGFIVKTVARGSPAEALGLRGGSRTATIDGQTIVVGGDIVLSVEGIPIGTLADLEKLRAHIAQLRPDQSFKASVLRAGRIMELTGKAP